MTLSQEPGQTEPADAVAKIAKAAPDVVISAVDGLDNPAFYAGLHRDGISPEKIPVVSFSLDEDQVRRLPIGDVVGQYAAWDYLQTIDRPENREFVRMVKSKLGADRIVSDNFQIAYQSVMMWAETVRDGETDTEEINRKMLRQSRKAPEGIVSIDGENRNAWRPFFLGKVRPDGRSTSSGRCRDRSAPSRSRPPAAAKTGRPCSNEPLGYPNALARTGIATRLLIGFLAISLIPTVILTGVTTYIARRSLELTVRQRLLTVADAKTAQLENFIRERRGDAAVLGRSPVLVEIVPEITEVLEKSGAGSPEYQQAVESARKSLRNFSLIYGYPNVHIVGVDGSLLMSLKPDLEPGTNLLTGDMKGTALSEALIRSRTLLQSALSDFQIYPGRKHPAAFIAGPIFKDGVTIGLVAFEFDNNEVFRVFREYNGLGQTGETQAAMRVGDELIFVAPLRHDPEAAFHTRLRIGSDMASRCSAPCKGNADTASRVDYRGRKAMAPPGRTCRRSAGAWSSSRTSDEAFDLIYHQRVAMGVLLGLTTLIVDGRGAVEREQPVAADPGCRERRRAGRGRRPFGPDSHPCHRRGRPAPPGGRDDDRGPPRPDRPDSEVEHRAAVHRDRDRRDLAPAGADPDRLRRLDQRGRRRGQGDQRPPATSS